MFRRQFDLRNSAVSSANSASWTPVFGRGMSFTYAECSRGERALENYKCKDSFWLFRRRDRSPSIQSTGPPFSIMCYCVCGIPSSRVPDCRLPCVYECVGYRAVHIARKQCVRPVIHFGLLHRLHAEPSHSFCARERSHRFTLQISIDILVTSCVLYT
ncbi:hypothetical protein EVAR_5178_1 [Eumeta japonica]|uniref:Uncharacterized protein n=1 Tax=Eumeta variegata TaxID=151549 RepID=A0A4C1V4R2_EUMVA|nr:hypothetical protein EVAR_5178_1 [Eumeta japonica]